MTEATYERLNDKGLDHGLTETQILELFGDQGEFADPDVAYDVLYRKSTLATEWLCSFWRGPFPAWLLEWQEQGRIDWQAKIDAASDDNPDFPGEKTWLESMVGAWEKEEGIEHPSPLHHVVHNHFSDVLQQGREAEYDRVQDIVDKLLVDAETGATEETIQQLQYAKTILEIQGRELLSELFSRGGRTPDFKFPQPLMGFANYSGVEDGMLF